MGYTIVELMMALAIFSVGITGIVALQTISANSNAHAKNLAVATAHARAWQDRLAVDAKLWGGEERWPIGGTRWLQRVLVADNDWEMPTADADGEFGPAAGPLGDFVDEAASPQDVVFCTHIRLTNILDELNNPGSGLIRTEVRVFWPKGATAWSSGSNYCRNSPGDIASIGAALDQFHFVYKTSVARQTPEF